MSNMMRCTILYHLHNLKNVKNTHEGVLLLRKSCRLQPILAYIFAYPSMNLDVPISTDTVFSSRFYHTIFLYFPYKKPFSQPHLQ